MAASMYNVPLLCLWFSLAVYGRETFLFGTKPAGGLWGAAIDSMGDGSVARMLNLGYPLTKKVFQTISYDSSENILVMRGAKPRDLSYELICSGNNKQPIDIATNATPIPVQGIKDCWDCKVTAIAAHGSAIYFLLVGEFGVITETKKKVQLRKLDLCAECRNVWDNTDYDGTLQKWHYTVKCSSVVATLHDTQDESIMMTEHVGLSLKPVEIQGSLTFFLHMKEIVLDEDENVSVFFALYHITADGGETIVNRVNKVQADNKYEMLEVWGLGSVDYRDDLLCWTEGAVVKCADFQDATMGKTHGLNFPGETVVKEICTGPESDMTVLLTGVAIATVQPDGHKSLFVGCYAQAPGTGGLGLLKVKPDWTVDSFQPVKDGERAVKGGVLVHMDTLPATCPTKTPAPQFCIPPNWPTTTAPTTLEPAHSKPQEDLSTNIPDIGYETPGESSGKDKDKISEQISEQGPTGMSVCLHQTLVIPLVSLFFCLCLV